MMRHLVFFRSIVLCALVAALPLCAMAEAPADGSGEEPAKAADQAEEEKPLPVSASGDREAGTAASTSSSSGPSVSGGSSGKSKVKYEDLVKDSKTVEGLIKLYRKDEKLYGEITSALRDTDLIVPVSIARGIGERPLLGGMTWGFGDDAIWQFRKTDDRIQVVLRNVRFRAAKGTPQEKAVHLAYTDSVLFSLPIVTTSPSGGDIVDLGAVFMSDLPQISRVLKGFSFAKDRSTWESVKGFKDNVEIQVAAVYSSNGAVSFDTVPDSRGVTIHVHYSISKLPETGYQPRLADDRVGYFLTAIKDYTDSTRRDRFVRYINRWDLRKAEASADQSPPKRPIVFWLEKTIPYPYRKPIREGILEWNKAFEEAGLLNAIEVRQQPDDAEWDPEDINYNTFRWITSSAGFAMGPSRVNPTTGEILDADIIFDADFLQSWDEDFEVSTPGEAASAAHGALDLAALAGPGSGLPAEMLRRRSCRCCTLAHGMGRQMALGSALLAPADRPVDKSRLKEFVEQGLKMIAMHEVGHTLGLRHNFKASAFLTLDEINDPAKTAEVGIAASVMDYIPANFSPRGAKQGDYFSTTVGPYDRWAIQYGYKDLPGDTEAELPALDKIASRCAEPALHYATDEDTRPGDPDPLSNRFDLGKDPLQFARRRMVLIGQLLPDLAERLVPEGEGYQQARRAFNMLLADQGSAMYFAARFVGGLYMHRDHKGDPDARLPFVVVDAKRQREALGVLEEYVLAENAYQFPPELYNKLAPAFWNHWGASRRDRSDYPVHEVILMWQDNVLAQLLSTTTLQRLADSELKVPADQDAMTAAELLERLTAAVFHETEDLKAGKFTNRKPAIRALRRSLQRRYLERLAALALGNVAAPEDCHAVARMELERLDARIQGVLSGKAQLDGYTAAHLKQTSARIKKVLDASVELRRP